MYGMYWRCEQEQALDGQKSWITYGVQGQGRIHGLGFRIGWGEDTYGYGWNGGVPGKRW